MLANISVTTSEKDIDVKYGLFDLGPEREMARASLKYIYTDMCDIKQSYFKLGFHLNEFKECKYYEDFGYPTFEEFCENNFDLDKSAISRCINVFLMTNASKEVKIIGNYESRGCASSMSDKYQGYSYSQLCEMLPLDDKQRSQVKPDMTIKQIREMKGKIVDITPEQIIAFVDYFKKNLKPCTYEQVHYKMSCTAGGYGTAYHNTENTISFSCSHGLYYIFNSKGYKSDKLLDYYKKCGGTFEEEIATSQPEEDDDTPLYSGEQFESEEFLEIMFLKFRDSIEYLSLDAYNFSRTGKRMTFEDLDGNKYMIQFSVSKKKEG